MGGGDERIITSYLLDFISFFACFIGAGIAGERIPVLAISASWFWLGVFTLTQLTTVALVIYGFKNLEAQKGSLIMPLEVVFGAIFGFLFFKEVLPVTIYIGGLIIASGACLSNYKVNK